MHMTNVTHVALHSASEIAFTDRPRTWFTVVSWLDATRVQVSRNGQTIIRRAMAHDVAAVRSAQPESAARDYRDVACVTCDTRTTVDVTEHASTIDAAAAAGWTKADRQLSGRNVVWAICPNCSEQPESASEPRVAGGVYWSGYWDCEYTVLSIERHAENGLLKSITVRWESGLITTHCTTWNAKRDRVISVPAE
jgi:hypothetical protein